MAPPALLSGSQPVTSGTRFDLSPAGVPLILRVPAGEILATATIRLAAVADTPAAVAPQRLSSDLGGFPAGKPVRFVEAAFDGEVAISSLTLAGVAGMARVRTFGNGVWTPLAPIDTVALGDEQTFPTVAAQRLNAEFLASNPPQAPVPVPAPLAVSGVALKATSQPCRVSVAVGDDPPFFSLPGPLPTASVSIDGLARIAARWLLDHPGTSDVPLRIGAAGKGTVVVAAFQATSAPAPAPPRPGNGTGPQPPQPPPDPPTPPDTRRALLCDDGHAAAQSFAPGPVDQTLAALALWVRPGSANVAGSVTLYPDDHGRPGDPAMADRLDFAFNEAASRVSQWLVLSLSAPVRPAAPWWAVCRVTRGELLWYRAPTVPAATGPLVTVDGGAWQDAAPDPTVAALQAVPSWDSARS
jgi:hypothetical protein